MDDNNINISFQFSFFVNKGFKNKIIVFTIPYNRKNGSNINNNNKKTDSAVF